MLLLFFFYVFKGIDITFIVIKKVLNISTSFIVSDKKYRLCTNRRISRWAVSGWRECVIFSRDTAMMPFLATKNICINVKFV